VRGKGVMVEIRSEDLPRLSATPANSITRLRKPEEQNTNLQHVATSNLTKEMKKEREKTKQTKKETNKEKIMIQRVITDSPIIIPAN
jgi:hypothetical protein